MKKIVLLNLLVIATLAYGIYDKKRRDRELLDLVDNYQGAVTSKDIHNQLVDYTIYRYSLSQNRMHFAKQFINCVRYFTYINFYYGLECANASDMAEKQFYAMSLSPDNYVMEKE